MRVSPGLTLQVRTSSSKFETIPPPGLLTESKLFVEDLDVCFPTRSQADNQDISETSTLNESVSIADTLEDS